MNKAIDCFEKSQQEILSLYYLGVAYNFGFGVEKNSVQALVYLQQAANQNHIYSQLALAKIFSDKKSLFYNIEQSMRYAITVANQGNREGLYIALDILFSYPEQTSKYINNISHLLVKLTQSSNVQDQIFANKCLSALNMRFNLSPKDVIVYITNAANLGDQDSIKTINLLKNESNKLQKKANAGSKQAEKQLVNIFLTLEEYSFISPITIINILNKQAQQGDAEALYILSTFYSKGLYLPKDDNRAFELLYASAHLGYQPAINQFNAHMSKVRQNIEEQKQLIKQQKEEQKQMQILSDFSESFGKALFHFLHR